MRVLIIEDEQSIADTIIYALRADGIEAEHSALAGSGIERLRDEAFDLLILDIGLDDINGFEACKLVRSFSDIPLIFLSARDHEVDRVVGLEIGGDDYVTKPFTPRELVARVKTILKRAAPQPPSSASDLFDIDKVRRELRYGGTLLALTHYEYGLLCALLAQPERVFSRAQLMHAVWPDRCGSDERAVDTQIKGLRAKLRAVKPDADPIRTHRGSGYSIHTGKTPG